jgi:hypothetical protein
MTDATAPSPPPTSVWQREEINAQIRNEAPLAAWRTSRPPST